MKKFISGLIIGVMVTSVFTAFAALGIKDAYFNTDIKVNYNGKPIDIEKVTVVKDGEVNGRTYGSINDVAIALGKSVSWDNATKTINITDTEVKSMSTVTTPSTTIEYDEATGLPVGAEYIDYEKAGKQFKAVKFNDSIYISSNDLRKQFGIRSVFNDPQNGTVTYANDNGRVIIKLTDRNNIFFAERDSYYKLSLFDDIIGE